MAPTGAPGAQAWAARLRGARSPRPGRGWARVARPHSPGSGSDRGRSSAAAVQDTQPRSRCADRAGNSTAAAAATAADASAWATAAAERSRACSAAAAFMGQARPRP